MRNRNVSSIGEGYGDRNFKIGDFVLAQRLAERDTTFVKGFDARYDDIIYRISGREGNSFIPKRKLVDRSWLESLRRYRHHQLQKVTNEEEETIHMDTSPPRQSYEVEVSEIDSESELEEPINADPKIIKKWIETINEYIKLPRNKLPAGFILKAIKRPHGKRIDHYLYINSPDLPQPNNGVIRSVPDIQRYFE
ncbi:hypothetical protein HK096_010763, partial [Nowakowskiella sp. JEL0078]